MNKQSLRKQMIHQLKLINPEEKLAIGKQLTTHLFNTSIWKDASVIGVTVSQNFEWDTKTIIEQAWEERKKVTVPKCNITNKQLSFYQIKTKTDLEHGYANIMEPIIAQTKKVDKQLIELLIVPGIMFDKHGYRIGFGGGYYDRFLSSFTGITVSLAHTKQIINSLPVEVYDIPVQFLITEKGYNKIVR